MIRNILIPFLIASLVFMPVIAHAETPPAPDESATVTKPLDLRMTYILKDAPSPFTGYLLTPDSAATIQGQLRLTESRLKLELDFMTQKSTIQLDLQRQLFETKIGLLTTQLEDSRKYSIQLEDKLVKVNDKFDWTPVAFIGGIVLGGLMAMGIVYGSAEAFK